MKCMQPYCDRKGYYYATFANVDLIYCEHCAWHIGYPFIKSLKKQLEKTLKKDSSSRKKLSICKDALIKIKIRRRIRTWGIAKNVE